ncbi:hypothetical protein A1O7_04298 [Cladophialophora yegresii CBS 114405]|uniref:Uncharacterized protein n=1 Tax=Cladophialophora yegresii CBS 114405 TaxID=1182544 RepID=W9W6J4_9EURO|nr:uncharacterized protein A1O7_04298 [Cladophialophora yegresii CBS 114405]EXJ60146.1 hypothetical protein A1O7_04298 [Cladophialophora yegresii CBS 114405]
MNRLVMHHQRCGCASRWHSPSRVATVTPIMANVLYAGSTYTSATVRTVSKNAGRGPRKTGRTSARTP